MTLLLCESCSFSLGGCHDVVETSQYIAYSTYGRRCFLHVWGHNIFSDDVYIGCFSHCPFWILDNPISPKVQHLGWFLRNTSSSIEIEIEDEALCAQYEYYSVSSFVETSMFAFVIPHIFPILSPLLSKLLRIIGRLTCYLRKTTGNTPFSSAS